MLLTRVGDVSAAAAAAIWPSSDAPLDTYYTIVPRGSLTRDGVARSLYLCGVPQRRRWRVGLIDSSRHAVSAALIGH